ncbi:MAG: ComF family protein [Anaerolineae bacterium]|nr:ComF family protein [Anaerolineae bacterium]
MMAETLAVILADAYHFYEMSADLLMPVPLHRSRHRTRGFNQSLLLANELGRLIDRPVDAVTLYRTRDTGHQMELNAHERHQNVADAFACRKPVTQPNILLIDDVCTTGATLDFCAMSLRMNGANAVWGLTLAKTR